MTAFLPGDLPGAGGPGPTAIDRIIWALESGEITKQTAAARMRSVADDIRLSNGPSMAEAPPAVRRLANRIDKNWVVMRQALLEAADELERG